METAEEKDMRWAAGLEWSEAAYWSKLYENNSGLRSKIMRGHGATAVALPEMDILAMNRVMGIGFEGLPDAKQIHQFIQFYEEAGSQRFFIQLSPLSPHYALLRKLLMDNGFHHHNNWVKLIRGTQPTRRTYFPGLTVRRVKSGEAEVYGAMIFRSFGWEDERLIDWLAASVGLPDYQHHFVCEQGLPIAASALHLEKKFGAMAFAATVPEHRGKGAQNLLLQMRIERAIELGAKYLHSETAEPSEEKPVASYRNMLRAGFNPAYVRENWLYTFA
ncbi:MAG: hypothetical protein LPK45_10715 [Bacteroidota bacterium]|nr:hypothetical protein [Bacteroidota bacterium]MDX5431572.1 hypothetical protein [Bacteroidota bacterium]MDX5470292.1 hypothetical protein [Bacteroidota bacterium]